jgi:type IV fimbrial biogenesis protein FimT
MMSPIGQNSGKSSNSSQAFTLIELILVMALLVIVLGVAFPSLKNFFHGRTLDSEARRFLSMTRYGQSRAVSEGVPMILWIDTKQGIYGLETAPGFSDEDAKAVQFALDKDLQVDVSTPTVATTTLGRMSENSGRAANFPTIRFSPDGFISESSPDRIVIREGTDYAVWIAQSPSRMNYEIQTGQPSR